MEAYKAMEPEPCCLVADDNGYTLHTIMAYLHGHGYRVDSAEDGQSALAQYLAAPGRYSFILLDLNMPVMNGYEAARRIRDSGCPGAGGVPIVAMTGGPLPGPGIHSFSAHLRKPFQLHTLLALLTALRCGR